MLAPEPPPPYVQGLNSTITRSPLQHRPSWNSLPPHLCYIDSYRQFQKQLKHICSNRLLTLCWFYMYVFRRCSYSFYMYIGGLQMLCDDDDDDDDDAHHNSLCMKMEHCSYCYTLVTNTIKYHQYM